MIITNLSEFPIIPTRKDLSVEEVTLTALQSTGVGLVSYSLKVGDIVEFPDNKESIRIMSRQVSKDSRMFGFVPEDEIEGTSSLRIWPFDKIGFLEKNE